MRVHWSIPITVKRLEVGDVPPYRRTDVQVGVSTGANSHEGTARLVGSIGLTCSTPSQGVHSRAGLSKVRSVTLGAGVDIDIFQQQYAKRCNPGQASN